MSINHKYYQKKIAELESKIARQNKIITTISTRLRAESSKNDGCIDSISNLSMDIGDVNTVIEYLTRTVSSHEAQIIALGGNRTERSPIILGSAEDEINNATTVKEDDTDETDTEETQGTLDEQDETKDEGETIIDEPIGEIMMVKFHANGQTHTKRRAL